MMEVSVHSPNLDRVYPFRASLDALDEMYWGPAEGSGLKPKNLGDPEHGHSLLTQLPAHACPQPIYDHLPRGSKHFTGKYQ